uniref:CCHC-type domain-containing protein n=2 Tax=Parascaris univalens TaxID=6257 RepID=A0A915BBR2_PARUN
AMAKEEEHKPKKGFRRCDANSEISEKEMHKLSMELIHTVESLKELKKKVQQMYRDGKVGAYQAGQLIRRWRVHDRQINFRKKKDKVVGEISTNLQLCQGQTLDDLKKLVNGYVAEGKIARHDAAAVVRNWKRGERRRVMRQLVKQKKKRCLYCRRRGHLYSQCPDKDEQTMGVGICFKCGSSEHTSVRCPRKNVKGFPYAVCFVCKQKGHLSRDCEENPNGIYPDGGSCDICGSQKHLKRDCPELQLQQQDTKKKGILITAGSAMSAGDEDVVVEDEELHSAPPKKKSKKKPIRF